ncbi:MAG: hypothetical protein IJE07_03945 [Clostridia bacterium]|nr:hypothetical protein [Clostridia bacterium]
MMFTKCPRCELNYILANERYCKVCMRDIKGDGAREEIEMCSMCNENPALPGRDICLFCLKEMDDQSVTAGGENAADGGEPVDPRTITGMDDVSSMDEIPEITADMSTGEMDISSLESMREEEDMDDEEEEEV